MNKRSFAIVALSTVCLATILAAVPTNSLVGYYDPWLDYDESGDIDMKDVAASARAFGSFGDPTKNVTVTNWPVSSQVTVWWDEPLVSGFSLWSGTYYSHGFTRVHILAEVEDLTGDESMELYVFGRIYRPSGGSNRIIAYSMIFTATSSTKDVTIFVPGETFEFEIFAGPATDGDVYLSFYLTWA